MKTMHGLWLEQQALSYCPDLPLPTPPPGEALVRVRLSGICATDLEMVRGYYPFTGVPGHEFVGEIVSLPGRPESSRGLQLGQRVTGEINASCGECEACRSGRPTHCETRSVLGINGRDGVFAGYVTLPVENLHAVPESVPDEAAVFVEPLAAALEIQQQVHIQPDSRVLLVGAGRLGQLVAQTLALTGCDFHVVARHAAQIELLRARNIDTLEGSQVQARKYDVVIEATGSPSGFELARRAVRPRGVMVLKSTYKGELTLNISSVVVDEITLVGSRCGPFPPAIHLLEKGLVDPTPLIQARYPLAGGVEAFRKAAEPGVMKVLLDY